MKKLWILVLITLGASSIQAQESSKHAKYLGEYSVKDAPFSTILISLNNGQLWGEAVGAGESELVATDVANTFSLASVPRGRLVFTAEKNIIKSLELIMDGQSVKGMRKLPALSDFAGVFVFEAGGPISKITVGEDNGLLSIDVPEFGQATIDNTSVIDKFYESNYQSDFIFIRNEKGEVSTLKINIPSQGMSIEGVKEMKVKMPSFDKYVGKYNFVDVDLSLKTEIREGKLYGITEQGEAFLTPTSKPDFFEIQGVNGTVEFKVNAKNAVTEAILTYDGQKMTAYPSAG